MTVELTDLFVLTQSQIRLVKFIRVAPTVRIKTLESVVQRITGKYIDKIHTIAIYASIRVKLGDVICQGGESSGLVPRYGGLNRTQVLMKRRRGHRSTIRIRAWSLYRGGYYNCAIKLVRLEEHSATAIPSTAQVSEKGVEVVHMSKPSMTCILE